jgi:tetratricopeptide (TPR) repeat protein
VLSKEAAALLEHMLAFYDRLAVQGGDDVLLRKKVAEANRRIGDIRQRLGHYEQSKAAYLRAIDLYKQIGDASVNNTEPRMETAKAQNELGTAYLAMNEVEAGRSSYMHALATLKAIAAETSDSPQYQYELARTYYFLGKRPGRNPGPLPFAPGGPRGPNPGPPDFDDGPPGPPPPHSREEQDRPRPPLGPPDRDSGRNFGPPPNPDFGDKGPPPDFSTAFPFFFPDDNQYYLRKALDLLEKLVAEHPSVPDYRYLLAVCYREAYFQGFDGGPDFTKGTMDKAIQILQKLVEEYPDVTDYRYDLSETYAAQDNRRPPLSNKQNPNADRQSREMLEKALAISEELVAEHPNIPDYAASQVFIRLRLARIIWENDQSGTESSLRKALDLQSALVRHYPKTHHYKFGLALINESLAELLQQSGKLSEARDKLQESITLLKDLSKNDPNAPPLRGVIAHHFMSLADLLRLMGEEQAAADASRQARDLRPEH